VPAAGGSGGVATALMMDGRPRLLGRLLYGVTTAAWRASRVDPSVALAAE
jgi:hypothetical protein